MKLYVVYDKNSGTVLHTHATYLLGQDEPVAATEAEVLALVPEPPEGTELAVAAAPTDFDPRDRSKRLVVDTKQSVVRAVPLERPNRSARSKK